MNRSLRSLAAATFVALAAAAPAQAAQSLNPVLCSDSLDTLDNAGYIACQGPLAGNIAANQNPVVTFAGHGSFSFVGASNDTSNTFAADPGQARWGDLELTEPVIGKFVLGIKGANSYSLYLFDAGDSGTSTLAFDTFGIVRGNGLAGPNLSHAALFMPLAAVPEPGSWALLLAGLGAVGFMARRRAR
jgi:opacity protein-like surface antigen